MKAAQKAAVIEQANARRTGISEEKSAEYSGREDVLRNFKGQGKRLNLDPVQVLAVYFGKHIDSIETFVRELASCDSYTARVALVNRGEGLVSRLDDARNYLDLLECLLVELNIHPDKIDRDLLAQAELLEEADKIDWSRPGYAYKIPLDDPPVQASIHTCPEFRYCMGAGMGAAGECCSPGPVPVILYGGADGPIKEGALRPDWGTRLLRRVAGVHRPTC